MHQTLRWFGMSDPVSLRDIRQAGAAGVVTALHEEPNGAVWPLDRIRTLQDRIVAAGLDWSVVESLPVHEDIKTGSSRSAEYIAAYCTSLRNLSAAGLRVVTYNFMPLLDWTRTDLSWELPDGARALRFEWEAIAIYDLFILKRADAERDYDASVCEAAERRFAALGEDQRTLLEQTIIAGLPGSEQGFTSDDLRQAIGAYDDIDAAALRRNHQTFLRAVCPVAEEVGITLVVHPDDPPFPIFGLPRVVSTQDDLDRLFDAVPSEANGLCFCAGSLGARPDNDLLAMARRFADRIGFLHLRSVEHEGYRTFHEAAHLEGSARMVELMAELVRATDQPGRFLPMRPDHGHQMLDDLGKQVSPGYSLLGRMRGLAELRGLELGLRHSSG